MSALYSFAGNGEGGSVALTIYDGFVEFEHINYFATIPLGPSTVVSYSKRTEAPYSSVKIGDIDFHCSNKSEVYAALLEVMLGTHTGAVPRTTRPADVSAVTPPPTSTAVREAPATALPFPLTTGFYVSQGRGPVSYLSFTPDGHVSAITVDGDATLDEVSEWLQSDDDAIGDYSVSESDIEFSTSRGGPVEYRGTFTSPTEIALEFRSDVSGVVAHERYVYLEVTRAD